MRRKPGIGAEKARRAKERLARRLRGQPGVRGVGLGWTPDGQLCVRVNVAPELRRRLRLPSQVDGVPVLVESVDVIELQSQTANRSR